MAYGINLAAGATAYTDANTIQTPEVQRVGIMVSNASIIYQLQAAALGGGSQGMQGNWLPERAIYCAAATTVYLSIDRRCTGFRFRNAVAGSVATVNVELTPAGEMPEDA